MVGQDPQLSTDDPLGASVEQALREAEARYRGLFEHLPLAALVYDRETLAIVAFNRAALAQYGYAADELARLTVADLHPAEELPAVRAYFRQAPHGVTGPAPWHHRRKDGSVLDAEIVSHDVLFAGRPARLAVITDVSERERTAAALRASEQALARSRAFLEKAQEVGHIGSWVSGLGADGTLHWSAETYRIFGLEPAAPLSVDDFFARVHAEDRERVRAAVAGAVAAREPYAIDHRIVRPDGQVRWVHESADVIRDPHDRPLQLIGVVRDVTDQLRTEEQLRQAQKMEAVGRLAGGIAHDFNNLLTIISGYSDLLVRRLGRDEEGLRLNEEVRHAAERASSLTRQLLAFGRRQVLQPKVLDLNLVAADTQKMLHRVIGEDIELTVVCEPGLGAVRADPGQVEQVLLNLAINARDAMPGGGRLVIETANVELDSAYAQANPGLRPGPYVMLSVADTGTGIDEAIKSHLFEPFFTTKEVGRGTGLGLAMVYGFVKQSGGHVAVQSEKGRGATFRVYLPRVASDAEMNPIERATGLPRGSETILLVEDERGVRGLAREILEAHGYRVIEASCGSEALVVARAHGGAIQLLVTDVIMPGMGGPALAAELAASRPGLRVMYISGYPENAFSTRGVAPAAAFLQKPFSIKALVAKVREVLDRPPTPLPGRPA